MLFMEMAVWWYGSGWLRAFKRSMSWVSGIWHAFSVAILLGTLFAPWRRIITLPGRSFDAKMRAMLDNLISRLVGFITRIFILLAASVLAVLAAIAGLVMALIWPLLPVALAYCLIKVLAG